jgi:hypothetical protein
MVTAVLAEPPRRSSSPEPEVIVAAAGVEQPLFMSLSFDPSPRFIS